MRKEGMGRVKKKKEINAVLKYSMSEVRTTKLQAYLCHIPHMKTWTCFTPFETWLSYLENRDDDISNTIKFILFSYNRLIFTW